MGEVMADVDGSPVVLGAAEVGVDDVEVLGVVVDVAASSAVPHAASTTKLAPAETTATPRSRRCSELMVTPMVGSLIVCKSFPADSG